MRKLLSFLLVASLITPVFADEYKDLSHEYNLVYQQFLREKILKLPKKVTVELQLKNGTVVKGVYENYVKYDDTFWILPDGKHGLFADDAYDISEIVDVRLIILRNV